VHETIDMSGSDGAGIIVIDRARRILFKNAFAESVLASNGSLVERHATLASRKAAIDRRLLAAVQGAASPSPHLLHLPRASGLPLLGMIVPLPASAAEDLGAMLLFWDPQAIPVLPVSVLRELFGLTHTEALTALATYEGRTPAEIAESRQRSVATVRTLLSRVFMKCGVRRQAELVRLLAGIGNACSFADGIRTGMDIQRSMQDRVYQHAALRAAHESMTRQLMQSHDMEALVRISDFAPGQGTPAHYHTHGHEVLCVLRGDLTTEFGAGEARVTPPGQARYVGENVMHRGHNPGLANVQVLSINMTQRGKWFRVEAPL
jgi:DNA-binding CsgD family transcriptional regulator/quercetin dioxygenase-like cupin family protein